MGERLHLLVGDDDFLTGRVIVGIAAEWATAAGVDVPVTGIRAGGEVRQEH